MRATGRMGAWAVLAGAFVLATVTAGRGTVQASPSQQAGQAVSIVDFAFNPTALTVPAGTRVTWMNTGQAPHTSSARGGEWNSGAIQPGSTFSFTFNTAGAFAYQCNIHPSMQGTIIVQGAATAAAAGAAGGAAQPRAQQPAGGAAPAMPRTGAGRGGDTGTSAWWLALLSAAVISTGAAGLRLRPRRR